jgi:hypothetical protein
MRSFWLAVVLGLAGCVTTQAGVVFSENWSSVTGTPINLGSDNYSQLGAGTYSTSPTLPAAWSQSGQVLGWSTTSSGVNGVLLNEDSYSSEGAISATISGLTLGDSYTLTFNYWGDNRPTDLFGAGSVYGLIVGINGGTTSLSNQSWATPGSGTFNVGTVTFSAASTSTTLSFAANTLAQSQSSPIIGEITLATAVPEPSTVALGVMGVALGVAAYNRRKSQARA